MHNGPSQLIWSPLRYTVAIRTKSQFPYCGGPAHSRVPGPTPSGRQHAATYQFHDIPLLSFHEEVYNHVSEDDEDGESIARYLKRPFPQQTIVAIVNTESYRCKQVHVVSPC